MTTETRPESEVGLHDSASDGKMAKQVRQWGHSLEIVSSFIWQMCYGMMVMDPTKQWLLISILRPGIKKQVPG